MRGNKPAAWIRTILLAAALYNIAWGIFVVLFPLAPFQWASMPVPNYPELRHSGCTFCRESLADISEQRESIEASGARIVLVHMGKEEYAAKFFRRYGLGDVPRISDPNQALYRAFGLNRGTFHSLFGPKVC